MVPEVHIITGAMLSELDSGLSFAGMTGGLLNNSLMTYLKQSTTD